MQINSVNIQNLVSKLPTLPFRGNVNKYSNLAPLQKDTVSFSGKKNSGYSSDIKQINQSLRPSLHTVRKIYSGAEDAYNHFKYTLEQIFNVPVIDIDNEHKDAQITMASAANFNKPVVMITTRRKSPNSIAEKMASQNLRSIAETKETLNDLIAARIIISGNSTEEGDYVLDKLSEAIDKKQIKIKEVKNHGQEDSSTNYVSGYKLGKFLKTAKKTNPDCKYEDQPRDTGYLALHIITDDIANGYNAEIQVMSDSVARLKEVEDLCYKCQAGKQIPKKYTPIKNLFNQLKEDPVLKEEYLGYTKSAYRWARLKGGYDQSYKYLPLSMFSNIPKKLDFNMVAGLKKELDKKEAS